MDSRRLDVGDVFREHNGLVERALRRHGVAERDLPDARQEVFLVVHRKLPQFEQRSLLSTWLYRIAINVASEFRRKACNRHEQLSSDFVDARLIDGLETVERRDQLTAVLRALDKLDQDKREVLVLYELLDLPMHEVAQRLGCPLKTAFSRLYAGRRRVLAELGERSSMLGLWLALRPLGMSVRTIDGGPRLVNRAWSMQSSIVVLAGICAILPAVPRADECAVASAPFAHGSMTTVAQSAQLYFPAAEAPASAWSRASQAPTPTLERARARTRAAQSVRKKSPLEVTATSVTATSVAATSIAGTGAAERMPGLDDFEIVHASAVDLQPEIQNPLAPIQSAEQRRPARLRLSGPADAADGIEAALLGTGASAR